MAYIISNKEIKGGQKYFNTFVNTDEVFDRGGDIYLSSNSRNLTIKTDDPSKSDIVREYEEGDCFYSLVTINEDGVYISVDDLGFEAPFFYQSEELWCISSELYLLLDFLKDNDAELSFDDGGVREFLRWGAVISGGTLFNKVSKLDKNLESISLGIDTLYVKRRPIFTSESEMVSNTSQAAKDLYENVSYFYEKQNKDAKYCLGMSGGLDSRVAGYFSSNVLKNVSTFFVGDKSNTAGVMTFDAKMAIDVNQRLGFGDIDFIKHDAIRWSDKISCDADNATETTANSQINIGYSLAEKFDYLINGAMGGELFGACVNGAENSMTDEQLVEYLYSYVTILPKQRFEKNIIAKILFKLGLFKKTLSIDDKDYDTVLPKKQSQCIKEELGLWVREKRAQSFSNIKITQLFLYEKLARNHRRGFFYGFNGKIKVVPTYFRPSVIEMMLKWDDDLFLNKKVQKAFLEICGPISGVRSQNVGDATVGNLDSKVARLFSKAERVLRGGGMNYQRWCGEKEFHAEMELATPWVDKLNVSPVIVKNSPSIMMNIIKLDAINKKYLNT